MQDDAFGHRHPIHGTPVGDVNRWTSWDYALSYALQVIEDYSDQYGLLVWELDDDAVEVNAIRKIHKFEQAKDEITGSKNYKRANGEYFVPDVFTRRSDGKVQTFSEWIEKKTLEQIEQGLI